MSYCRWSSDDHQCDVYVYEDCGGWWQTYVAGRKRRLREGVSFPPPVEDVGNNVEAWLGRHKQVREIIDEKNEGILWDWEDLPEQYAGANFSDDTPGECADTLEMLRAAGYSVPQYAIDALREEQAEMVARTETAPTHGEDDHE